MSRVIGVDHSSAVSDFAILACGVWLAKNHYQETKVVVWNSVMRGVDAPTPPWIDYITFLWSLVRDISLLCS